MVGSEPILESDVIGLVNRILEANKARIPPEQYASIREELIKKQLTAYIQNKQIYLDAKRSIPSEGWPSIEKQLTKAFDESEINKLMTQEDVTNRRQLEAKLRTFGSSLEREKRVFMERELASQWVQQQIKRDEEITYDQMVKYYHDHLDEFTKPAKAKWEEIAVRISKYPAPADAKNAIAELGNQVVLGGAAFTDVAKKSSDGATASSGGRWDWTSQGSLVSKEIDTALFTLQVGQPSPILESNDYFHIVRVTDRDDAGTLPFLDAQVKIREKIVIQRFEKQKNEYLAKIAARIKATTIFDQPATAVYDQPTVPVSTPVAPAGSPGVPQMSSLQQQPMQ